MQGGDLMRIIDDTIEFKSTPENYFKERDNLKCNTVRRFDKWSEMREFSIFAYQFEHEVNGFGFKVAKSKKIKISCSGEGIDKGAIKGATSFERIITDITQFESYWIISWQDTRVK